VKKTLILLIIVFLFMVGDGHAQEQIRLKVLDIDLWPEHDRPTMLVIYHATLDDDVSLPAEVTFRIPAAAGRPHAVAVGPSPGIVGDVNFTTREAGEWVIISFIATLPAIQFEYYDPALQIEGTQRRYQFNWPGDYAVDSFSLRVQQPVGATDLRLSPGIGTVAQGQDGLLYHQVDIGSLEAGDRFSISLEYTKETDRLTVESLQIQPTGPVAPDNSGRLLLQILPWALGVLGIALVVGGILWYRHSSQVVVTSRSRPRRKSPHPKSGELDAEEDNYCHQCGKRANPGDRFCRSCGTRIQV
jgi:hypothetical protein